MLKEERQQVILELLKHNGKVVATELSTQLQVSEDTIRRDLRDLAEQGRMLRVHGGALPHSPAGISYEERLRQVPAAKAAIAQAAVRFLQNGQTIFLDSGTTTRQLASILPDHLKISVITNSPSIAVALSQHESVEVIVIGGRLDKEMQVVTGSHTVDAIRAIHTDICFLGICSLDVIGGITVVDYEESVAKRAMIDGCDQLIALSAKEKLGTISPFKVAPITSVDTLITNQDPSDGLLTPYEEIGVQLLTV